MRSDDVAVVVPVYRLVPSEAELLALTQLRNTLGRFQIVFLCGDSFDLRNYRIGAGEGSERFSDSNFRDTLSYSQLLLSDSFYERFSEYEYILIHQLDAYVFKDRLLEFCDMGFDYIGAPWLDGLELFRREFFGIGTLDRYVPGIMMKKRVHVGNGGFSLRRVSAVREVLCRHDRMRRSTQRHEDVFLAKLGWLDVEFKVAPLSVAMAFAFETEPRRVWAQNGSRLPFGIHGWDRYDPEFMRELMTLGGGIVIASE